MVSTKNSSSIFPIVVLLLIVCCCSLLVAKNVKDSYTDFERVPIPPNSAMRKLIPFVVSRGRNNVRIDNYRPIATIRFNNSDAFHKFYIDALQRGNSILVYSKPFMMEMSMKPGVKNSSINSDVLKQVRHVNNNNNMCSPLLRAAQGLPPRMTRPVTRRINVLYQDDPSPRGHIVQMEHVSSRTVRLPVNNPAPGYRGKEMVFYGHDSFSIPGPMERYLLTLYYPTRPPLSMRGIQSDARKLIPACRNLGMM
jgi:hypothetical protein